MKIMCKSSVFLFWWCGSSPLTLSYVTVHNNLFASKLDGKFTEVLWWIYTAQHNIEQTKPTVAVILLFIQWFYSFTAILLFFLNWKKDKNEIYNKWLVNQLDKPKYLGGRI